MVRVVEGVLLDELWVRRGDLLPLVLSGLCGQWEEIRIQEIINCSKNIKGPSMTSSGRADFCRASSTS